MNAAAHDPVRRWHPAAFVGHDIYRQAAYGRLHPLTIARVEAVIDVCRALDWFVPGEYVTSPTASEDELLAFHSADYVAALRAASASGAVAADCRARYAIGTMENPLFAGLFERASTAVGGSIAAAELALDGRVGFNPAGGTHHGRRDRASGFSLGSFSSRPTTRLRSKRLNIAVPDAPETAAETTVRGGQLIVRQWRREILQLLVGTPPRRDGLRIGHTAAATLFRFLVVIVPGAGLTVTRAIWVLPEFDDYIRVARRR